MTRWIAPLLLVVVGLLFLVGSGNAEGYASVRSLPLLAALLANLVAAIALVAVAVMLVVRRAGPLRNVNYALLVGFIAMDLLVYAGCAIDRDAIAETKTRGDALVASVESYRGRFGRLPGDIEELEQAGYAMPVPALKGSAFSYRVSEARDQFVVSFPSIAFLVCEKSAVGGDWQCDD